MINTRILQVMLTKGIGDVAIKKILDFLHFQSLTIDDLFLSPTLFLDIGIKSNIAEAIMSSEMQNAASSLAAELKAQNISLLSLYDTSYPTRLRKQLGSTAPPILFAKGNISLLNEQAVGFCGSRKASPKGIGIASDCAKQLTEKNITVVSGYAAGTDLAAHSAALKNNGKTIFVLSEGILRTTIKKEISSLITDKNHVFISQFSPKVTWNAGNAMKRNSVIIGLSQAMILVESGKSGGTFAAGEESLKLGCPLFVIDFAKPEVSAEANPYFIQAGGHPIRGKAGIPNLEKVFAVIQARESEPTPPTLKKPSINYEQLKLNF